MFKITHIQRKKTFFFSVENIFSSIRSNISKKMKISLFISKYSSSGILKRLYNICEMFFLKSDLYHVLGDVHYLTISLNSKKTILTILDCVSLYKLKGLKYYFIYFFWYYLPVRRVKHVTVISNYVKKELIETTGCNPKKVSVIYCCISNRFFETQKKKLININNPTIIMVGTTSNKNLNRAFECIAKTNCKLIIIGNLSKNQILDLKKFKINYENFFDLSEYQLIQKYLVSDILLFPSTYEGFGLPIIEANALGIPVITSNVCSMPEVAMDAAILVNPYSTNEIINAINALKKDSKLRNKLITNGFRNSQRFRVNTITKQYEELYRKNLNI